MLRWKEYIEVTHDPEKERERKRKSVCVREREGGLEEGGRRNRKLSLMSFLILKALKAGYTRLARQRERERESRSIQSFQEIIRLLPFYLEAKVQNSRYPLLIAAIAYFNLGPREVHLSFSCRRKIFSPQKLQFAGRIIRSARFNRCDTARRRRNDFPLARVERSERFAPMFARFRN